MKTDKISFNDIPEVLDYLVQQVDQIGSKLDQLSKPTKADEERWMDINEVCDYIPCHPAVGTVYKWTSARLIPFHKRGKNVMFKKSEIDRWIQGESIRTKEDVKAEALADFKGKAYLTGMKQTSL